jgi:hypothetical protein
MASNKLCVPFIALIFFELTYKIRKRKFLTYTVMLLIWRLDGRTLPLTVDHTEYIGPPMEQRGRLLGLSICSRTFRTQFRPHHPSALFLISVLPHALHKSSTSSVLCSFLPIYVRHFRSCATILHSPALPSTSLVAEGQAYTCAWGGLCLRPRPPRPPVRMGGLRVCLRLSLCWVVALESRTQACWPS